MLLFSRSWINDEDGFLDRPTELADCLLLRLGQYAVLHGARDRRVEVLDLFDESPDLPRARGTTRQGHVRVAEGGGQEAGGVEPVLRGRPGQPQRGPDVLTNEVV